MTNSQRVKAFVRLLNEENQLFLAQELRAMAERADRSEIAMIAVGNNKSNYHFYNTVVPAMEARFWNQVPGATPDTPANAATVRGTAGGSIIGAIGLAPNETRCVEAIFSQIKTLDSNCK